MEIIYEVCQMGSGTMTEISSFMQIGWGIKKLITEDSQTKKQHGDIISLLLFSSK
jgi:hypothetical protein